MHPLILVYTFILGTLIGSFLNVVVYRVPREESLSFPPSHCPSCNTRLKAYDLVPVVSYLFLGGKCRTCKTAISIRYPLVEMLTGLLFLVTVMKFGVSLEALKYLLVIALLLPVALIDYDHTIIPDRLNVGIFLTALSFLLLEVYLGNAAFRDLLNPLYGMFLGGGFSFLSRW